MAADRAVSNRRGPFRNGNAMLDMQGRRAALAGPPATLALPARQIVSPAVILVARQLSVDEAVDGLRSDHTASVPLLEPGAGLLRRPSLAQTAKHLLTQRGIALQPCALPAARLALLLGVAGLVARLHAT